jgi:hypothetical protein
MKTLRRTTPGLPRLASIALFALVAAAGLLAPLSGARAASVALAAPEPSPVPRRWQLDLACAPLRMTTVDTPSGPQAFYYLTYRVTNNSPQDILLAPMWELATDTGKVLRSGRDVPVSVTRTILSRLNNPFLEDQISIVGTILRGPENAKEGLVIWPVPDTHLNEVVVYGAGFSGENATVEIPGPEGKPEKKVLRKTYMMRFAMPGELETRQNREFPAEHAQWIMR